MQMMGDASMVDSAPDFAKGVSIGDVPDGGSLLGTVDGDAVLLARVGDELFAVGARCTHYHGPLADGLIVGDTVRCPWHHACFSLRTGEALRAPALDAIQCWRVDREGDWVVVREKLDAASSSAALSPSAASAPSAVASSAGASVSASAGATGAARAPESVVIIGGGAAGLAAADILRREGYDGPITMISADEAPPSDRPNLSKDYLAGNAQEDWIPLRGPEFYTERRIDLRLNTRVSAIDVGARQVRIDGGAPQPFGALLIATGADPVRLPIPGADSGRVHYLRSFADSRAIVDKARGARHAVVVGASFIGLEVAASLRAREIAVDVVAPERVPLERVMGLDIGRELQRLHESHGVVFHLGETVTRVDDRVVTLSGGTTLDADFVVMGVGVRPALALAEQAGLTMDRGIAVNAYLETSAPGVFAAGDVARWPDPHTGDRIRVEHWVVAERQGQVAARNILGRRTPYDAVPFFWSQHYDVTINYVGHAEQWDRVAIDGDLAAHDATVTYWRGDRRLAVATIGRDRVSLDAELAIEREV
jgi:NADPH-dependent 2,4-dienoyl-CoA reductase/sulfur reductase-like enzyme/nitrite reductase/ring-hydroxylating ferredoxin subunit